MVEVGQLLVVREERRNLPNRFEWWVVKAVRKLKNGDASVKLLCGGDSYSAEATARFPDGVVRDPFRLVKLSQDDWRRVWEGRPDA